ncbi:MULTISPECIES: glycosyltransferase family 9 protein [unclassified Sulfuricurvum]|uniref:glycosyltransferase family 9 protein n=1 Tax=unclassified Sulfuricurvum TaxID=2632390 RepID=UPI0002997A8F|nr:MULTISPECIES: glycosyltransferase family 9 protein [unclassified Sulfuricurvum]AFV98294.1 putative glycosyltransferase [Candidatus Sulfuricurvum sp. RIFRC-1]HBM34823.1 glycosyltransferase family 9 protein [Sulfuricurvum sp.]
MSVLKEVKRALILRCGALGDLVYATAVIDALRAQYGDNIIIDFITTPGTGKLFENDPRIHQTFPLKHKKLPIWLSPQKRAIIRYSKEHPYDLLISLEFGKQFKSLINAIHATHKTGMGILETAETQNINRGEVTKHYYRDVIDPTILLKAKPILFGKSFEELKTKVSLPERYIVIAPSNSHNQKKGLNYRAWPFEHWKSLIQSLAADTPIVIVGAKGEEAFFDQIKPYPENVIDLVGMLSISELITTVQHGAALICTDSATGHIGASIDTPTFVLMGPNNPITDSPYQSDANSVHPISLKLPCSPCYKTETMKQCRENICMSQIIPTEVLKKLTAVSN